MSFFFSILFIGTGCFLNQIAPKQHLKALSHLICSYVGFFFKCSTFRYLLHWNSLGTILCKQRVLFTYFAVKSWQVIYSQGFLFIWISVFLLGSVPAHWGLVRIYYSHMPIPLQVCNSASCHGGNRMAFSQIVLASAEAGKMDKENQSKHSLTERAAL